MAPSVTTPVAVVARKTLSSSPTTGVRTTIPRTRARRSVRINCGQVRRKSRSDSDQDGSCRQFHEKLLLVLTSCKKFLIPLISNSQTASEGETQTNAVLS